jgi:iron complex transport system ATP-binding protein
MAETLIELKGVEVPLRLGPVDLKIGRGDFLGVVGPNGAGKSTLLHALHGGIRFGAGVRTGRADGGFLFQQQECSLTVPFRVEEVVAFGRAGRRPRNPGAVEAALEAFELLPLRRRLYRELSGGERQKVQFARLLATEAEILFLDEPTAGLDPDWQERVTGLVEMLYRRHRRTMVMVTHDLDRLPACCNQAALIKNGRILKSGPPAEVFTPSALSELYGCCMEVVVRDERFHAFSTGAL